MVVATGVHTFDTVPAIPPSMRRAVESRLRTARNDLMRDPVDAELVYQGGLALSPRLADQETSSSVKVR